MKPSAGQDDLRGVEWRYFWQVCQGEQAYVFRQFTNLTAELAISPNGRTLVIPDHALHIVDLASRKELYTLTNHAGGLRAIAFSPTGDLFISAGADDTIKFWDTGSWREVGPAVRQKGVIALTFSPDGNTFAAGTDEGGRGSFQLWNVVTRERVGDPVRTPTEVTGLS